MPEAGHKAWVTIREQTFRHAMAGQDCCNEQLHNVLCFGSAFALHEVSKLCQITYKCTNGIIALQCHQEISNQIHSYTLKYVHWWVKGLQQPHRCLHGHLCSLTHPTVVTVLLAVSAHPRPPKLCRQYCYRAIDPQVACKRAVMVFC